jgi:hypothetical protein
MNVNILESSHTLLPLRSIAHSSQLSASSASHPLPPLHNLHLASLYIAYAILAMTDNRSEGPSNAQAANLPVKESGRFGHTPSPSEYMGPPETPSGQDSRSSSSPTDVFGLVLLLGAVQEIWQVKSLFCYRGLWQDDRRRNIRTESHRVRQAVVLTIATGISCTFFSYFS